METRVHCDSRVGSNCPSVCISVERGGNDTSIKNHVTPEIEFFVDIVEIRHDL
jgi:hypothetical protein